MSSADDKTVEAHGGHHAAWALRAHGVDTLFTLSGGHIFPLYDGCVKEDIRLIDVRHEQTAVFAAEGYAKVSRRPGVAALTAGPGVTNGVSAITTAHFTGSPVAVLGGRAPHARWGHGSLQELDHVPILETVTKRATTSETTEGIGGDVDQLLRAARSSHRGPTFLDVPMDLFFGTATAEKTPRFEGRESDSPPDSDSLERIAQLLLEAERPVLMAGADVYWEGAELELQALAEAGRLPVFMNGLGRGTLPADHELAFSRCRSTAFKGGDLVVVIGTPLDFRLGFGRFGEAKVVHVMDRPDRVSQHVELAASAGGSLTDALRGLREALPDSGASHERWIDSLTSEESAKRAGEAEILRSDADPIHPGRIYGELAQRLDRDAVVIGDGGDFVSYAGKYVDTFTPGCFLDPGPYGCLGTGPGYALGAHAAAPDRQLVLLLGDGAAGFSLGDLDTLVRFEVPVTIVVGNNVCWGLEKHPMQHFYGYHVAAELSEKARYDRVLEALGGAGETVDEPQGIGAALERALAAGRPYLVNVMTDPENVYPRSSNLG